MAESDKWPDIVNVPTGSGKTEATIIAWLWKRYRGVVTPRRLAYSLPMRGLVEQTHSRIASMVANLKSVLGDDFEAPFVEKLLGGEVGEDWIASPTAATILIGTQDLLLSRALNRGYAMSRFSWPMAFGWLNNDVLWIIDEVQLQGVGVTTSAQLQGLRERLGCYHRSATIFVSATIDRAWLVSADYDIRERAKLAHSIVELTSEDRQSEKLRAVIEAKKILHRIQAHSPLDVARAVLEKHRAGTRTLVIVNRVNRAKEIAESLRRSKATPPVYVLHSRFRPTDRDAIVEKCFGGAAEREAIVIATQVIEAGIDTTCATLFTDIAPWASLVQRFGRCNRRGEEAEATVYWLDPGELGKTHAAPYDLKELISAKERLDQLEGRNVGPEDLPEHVDIPREHGATLRTADILDLFDTTPDLSGNDVDVSRFIRVDDDFNVSAFWRSDDNDLYPAHRSELCPVPRSEMVKLLERLAASNRSKLARIEVPARHGNQRAYAIASPTSLKIGEIVRLDSNVGCYDAVRGFDLAIDTAVSPIEFERVKTISIDQRIEDDGLSFIKARVSLRLHSEDCANFAAALRAEVDSAIGPHGDALLTAARWHDCGKVHPVFQTVMERSFERVNESAEGGPWAKSLSNRGGRYERAHFRHELVSALAWISWSESNPDATRDDDLIAFLIAAHHGRARVSLQAFPGESLEPRSILGVQDGDKVPSAQLGEEVASPNFTIDLDLFDVGGTLKADGSIRRSWLDRVLALRDRNDLGIFRLAYLESLVRVADWRASKFRSSDLSSYELHEDDASRAEIMLRDELEGAAT